MNLLHNKIHNFEMSQNPAIFDKYDIQDLITIRNEAIELGSICANLDDAKTELSGITSEFDEIEENLDLMIELAELNKLPEMFQSAFKEKIDQIRSSLKTATICRKDAEKQIEKVSDNIWTNGVFE